MSRPGGRRWVGAPVAAVTVALALPLATLFGAAWVGGWRLQAVETSSMDPTLPAGSMLVSEPIDPADVAPGMVVAFVHPEDRSRVVSHRIVRVLERRDGLFFRTKGDANREVDSHLVPASDVRSRVRWHVPDLGAIVRWLAWPRGFLVLVVVPALLLVAGEVRDLVRRRRADRGFPRCEPERPSFTLSPVQFLLDLNADDDGRVSGQVAAADQPPVPFSGWLELLRLLEHRTDVTPTYRQETT